MNREIKFRVWTGQEMITPPKECIGSGSSVEIIEISIAGHVYTRNAYGLDGFSKNPTFDEPITDYKLMQFTGLKDKNGTEIYEGDILLYLGAKGMVFYESETAMFLVSFKSNSSNWSFDSMDEIYEIIGNIHQNSELITNG